MKMLRSGVVRAVRAKHDKARLVVTDDLRWPPDNDERDFRWRLGRVPWKVLLSCQGLQLLKGLKFLLRCGIVALVSVNLTEKIMGLGVLGVILY